MPDAPGNPFADSTVQQDAPGNPFAESKQQIEQSGYLSEVINGVSRGVSGIASGVEGILTPHDTVGATREQEAKMGPTGRLLYNIPADTAEGLANAEGARQKSAKQGENWAGQALSYAENLPVVGGIVRKAEEAGPGYAKFTPQTAGAVAEGATYAAAPKVAEKTVKGAVGLAKDVKNTLPAYTQSAEELASATPERIADLKTVEGRWAHAQQVAVQAEKDAHAAAKAAYPDVKTPIIRTRTVVTGDEFTPKGTQVVQEKVPFSQVQEEYSNVGKQIMDEQRAVQRGAAPRYDLAKLADKYNDLANEMKEAARADDKLPEFKAAQQKWRQYMNDFHNTNSPVRPLLETTPDQTAKISNHFLNPDKGARTLEVLRRNGVDVAGIQRQLSRGSSPVKMDVTEAAKLRKAGSDEGYRQQRINEAVDQLTTNRLPAGTEAKVPALATRSHAPGVAREIPFADETISPKAVALRKLKGAQKGLSGEK